MSKICLCLTGKTIEENIETARRYSTKADLVELRADFLLPEERLQIRRFPELCPLPAILTVRRPVDGGRWPEGEASRLGLYARGLAYAESDPRKNYAYVDLESDVKAPAVEEAARAFGSRIIRSYHDTRGLPPDVMGLLRQLPHYRDEIPKLAVRPNSMADNLELLRAFKAGKGERRILLGMGEGGQWTRLLARELGSYLSYASALSDGMDSAAPGQVDPGELSDFFGAMGVDSPPAFVACLSEKRPVSAALVKALNRCLRRDGQNCIAFPMLGQYGSEAYHFAKLLPLSAVVLSEPSPRGSIGFCGRYDRSSLQSNLVSLVIDEEGTWRGFDPDSAVMAAFIQASCKHRCMRFLPSAVLGNGDTARFAQSALRLMGAREIGVKTRGLALAHGSVRVIVKTEQSDEDPDKDDPIADYEFSGKECLIDVSPGPRASRLVIRAEAAGALTVRGDHYWERRAEALSRCIAARVGA